MANGKQRFFHSLFAIHYSPLIYFDSPISLKYFITPG
jgi:hypothetical protein